MWMHTVVSYFNTLAWENRSKFCTRSNWLLTEKLSPSVLCFERGLCSSTNPCCLLALVGICLIYLGVAYCSYYTVLFGVARSLGVLSQVGCKNWFEMVMFCTFQVWKKMMKGNYSDNYIAGIFFFCHQREIIPSVIWEYLLTACFTLCWICSWFGIERWAFQLRDPRVWLLNTLKITASPRLPKAEWRSNNWRRRSARVIMTTTFKISCSCIRILMYLGFLGHTNVNSTLQ